MICRVDSRSAGRKQCAATLFSPRRTIPGTKRRRYLEDNVGALSVELTPEDLALIDSLFPLGAAAGGRYPEARMAAVNR